MRLGGLEAGRSGTASLGRVAIACVGAARVGSLGVSPGSVTRLRILGVTELTNKVDKLENHTLTLQTNALLISAL